MINFTNPYNEYQNSINMLTLAIEKNDKDTFLKSVEMLINICISFPEMNQASLALAEIFRQFGMPNESKAMLSYINNKNNENLKKITESLSMNSVKFPKTK